jgi:hypothetical protein
MVYQFREVTKMVCGIYINLPTLEKWNVDIISEYCFLLPAVLVAAFLFA